LIVFPNCKINLGLQVLQKRNDGFHDIATVFYPVPLKDALEIIPLTNQTEPSITTYGLPIQGAPGSNLCIRAWQFLKKDFPDLPVVQIHLLKNIPMGAGLGGGSANGAFMLQLLNNKYKLGLSQQQLLQYALQLGSDCPFFIGNKPCYATGRGEIMEALPLTLAGYHLVLINMGIHVNTAQAFTSLNLSRTAAKASLVKEIIGLPVSQWKDKLVNDFEDPVFDMHPVLKDAKEQLYSLGAVYASMSGSGSVVFGLFKNTINITGGVPANWIILNLGTRN
jgi:4-diphosphocytidyl-2-C-methyl-D-erythritol kinase